MPAEGAPASALEVARAVWQTVGAGVPAADFGPADAAAWTAVLAAALTAAVEFDVAVEQAAPAVGAVDCVLEVERRTCARAAVALRPPEPDPVRWAAAVRRVAE